MSSTAQHNGAPSDGSPAALEAQVERDREQLAATVDALHHKLDVRAHAKARAARLKDRATTDSGRPAPAALGLAAVALAGLGLLVWRRAHG
jgi:hypothetical protein